MSLRYAYNTNGMAHHRLDDALDLLGEHGYDGVALTLDHHHLDPLAPGAPAEAQRVRARLDDLGLAAVVETGARYLLDPRAKHEPTFVTPDAPGRARRLDFLRRTVDVAGVLGAETVSFWAGVPRAGVDRGAAWEWLVEGVARLAEHAAGPGVALSFEPEPGMLVETPREWERLRDAVAQAAPGTPPLLLALDSGHCIVTGDLAPDEAVRAYADRLGTVAVEDMRRGVHEHLAWGEGDMDVPAVLAALDEVGYRRLVTVELSRDSHRAHELVPRTIAYLRAAEARAADGRTEP
ncbi:sugar phosphate isomerase/epimerase family protein [Vallicoccus soli]|uniref:Sugar phosphate isomerase/epimerase n=1 Tax=Vallicoccus soli TaxID=2339232 RepID=A0A3A3YZS7_9ACTN|nr:sugar phosphate isomerase/epimerase family protein [Vallicoccus soli]RJK96331.1 sugar phosphate isomerase/epimerase [Vallicoccus soli]